MDDCITEIISWLDPVSQVMLALSSKEMLSRVRLKSTTQINDNPDGAHKKITTSWLVACAEQDYPDVLDEIRPDNDRAPTITPLYTPIHIYSLRGRDPYLVCLISAAKGAIKMLAQTLTNPEIKIDSQIVCAALQSHSLETLRIVLDNTTSTLKDYTLHVISADGLLWIPRDMLVGVHHRIMKTFQHALIQSCNSVATLRELHRLGAIPSREYISSTELSRGVICELILSGAQVAIASSQLIDAINFSLARDIIKPDESLRVFLGSYGEAAPPASEAIDYLKTLRKYSRVVPGGNIVSSLVSAVGSADWLSEIFPEE